MNTLVTPFRFSLLLSLTLIGCSHRSPADLPPDDAPCASHCLANVQAANAARADAMLYPHHFDGEQLNSLGRAKLDAMLASDRQADPLTVYLNLPDSEKDSGNEGRRAAVSRYLHDRGLSDSQFRFQSGPNPDSRSTVAPVQRRLEQNQADTVPLPVPSVPPQ